MRYGDFLSSLSSASSHSGGISLFSQAHGSGGHVRVNRLKTRAPIILYTCTEHAQFVDVSKFEFMAATFHEGLWT